MTGPELKRALTTLPVASTSFTADAVFVDPGGDVELRFEFERDGIAISGGLRFEKVRAYRFRAESHCTLWHVEDTYDTLVEVSPSSWSAELSDAESEEAWGNWVMRHFLIYLDSAGAYEV